jgi:DNA-binding FadR family transcriptional regulator
MTSEIEFLSLHRQERLSVRAADQIAQMILDHTLSVGERLPSERRLSEMLGVSRTVVREAVRLLEARRLVEVRPGRGAIVRGFSADAVSESISRLMEDSHAGVSFEDVHAVRSVLEIATVRLAAQNATPEDLDRLEDALNRMICAGSVETHLAADRDFHLAIAMATHNRVFVLLVQALIDIMMETWYAYWKPREAQLEGDCLPADEEADESNILHRQIFQAIRAGDPNAVQDATLAMLDHWSQMYSAAFLDSLTPH